MQRELPTVAVALFVKNEFSDIKGWISWYFALGVKTLFIFDDHSSDGTWDILLSASKRYDIRLFRTDTNEQDFYKRQTTSFLAVAEMCKGHYDWLGFLDGDEYLYIRHFDSLPEFFYRFDHADAVAFSWRIYGHSNTVLRPRYTAVEAFVEHSTKGLGDNQLIKTFLRPEKLHGSYGNPHWYDDIDPNRYVRPHGGKVKVIGPNQEVDWSDAFVMHYICRSMEHFIQRVRMRPDNTSYWDHFNHSQEQDREPLRFIPKVDNFVAEINKVVLHDAIQKVKMQHFVDSNMIIDHRQEIPTVFRLKTYCGSTLFYNAITQTVIHAMEDKEGQHGYVPIIGLVYPSIPNIIIFRTLNCDVHFLRTYNEPPLYDKLIYSIEPASDDKICLKKLSGDLYFYVCFGPIQNGENGWIEENRLKAQEFETVTLEPFSFGYENNPYDYSRKVLPFRVSIETTVNDIIEWIAKSPENPSGEEFLSVMNAVSPSVRDHISKYLVPGLLWPFL